MKTLNEAIHDVLNPKDQSTLSPITPKVPKVKTQDVAKDFIEANRYRGMVGSGWANTHIPVGITVRIRVGNSLGIYTVSELVDKADVKPETVLPFFKWVNGEKLLSTNGDGNEINLRDLSYFLKYNTERGIPVKAVVAGSDYQGNEDELEVQKTEKTSTETATTQDGADVKPGDLVFAPDMYAIASKGKAHRNQSMQLHVNDNPVSATTANGGQSLKTADTFSDAAALNKAWDSLDWTTMFKSVKNNPDFEG